MTYHQGGNVFVENLNVGGKATLPELEMKLNIHVEFLEWKSQLTEYAFSRKNGLQRTVV